MDEIPHLSSKAIPRMLCSEIMVDAPIFLQVLDSSRVQHRGFTCATVLLSDGLHTGRCYWVPEFAYEVYPPQKYTLVMVSHYYRSITQTEDGATKVCIEIDDLMLLEPYTQSIGDPQPFDESSINVEHAILRTKLLATKAKLTEEALPRIMVGKILETPPIIQVFSAKLRENEENLVMSVSDGERVEYVTCTQPLSRQLLRHASRLILSIIQLDKYVLTNGCIVVSQMTWLNWGSHVCFARHIHPRRSIVTMDFMYKVLQKGKLIRDPIVQICKIERVQLKSENKQRVRLVIFDGWNTGFAYLSTQLERSVRRSLRNRCIVRLDVYKGNHVCLRHRQLVQECASERPCSTITIFAMTLLNRASNLDLQNKRTSVKPTLTDDGIDRLFSCRKMEKVVVKVVQVQFMLNGITGKNFIRLVISDGMKKCNADLPVHMNYLRPRLEQMPIVLMEQYYWEYRPGNNGRDLLRKIAVLKMSELYRKIVVRADEYF